MNYHLSLLIHTDNVITATNNKKWLDDLISQKWSKEFKAEYVNQNSILGLMVVREDPYTFSFSQPNYIEELINEFHTPVSKPQKVPIRDGIEHDYDPSVMSTIVDSNIPYRRLVMKLKWVERGSRPEIAYAVGFFSRFQNCYTQALYDEMLKVVAYLNNTKGVRQIFNYDPSKPSHIKFVCDASLSNNADNKSTIGILGYVQNCVIFVSSKTVKNVLTSSCETESHAIFEASKIAVYTRNWCRQLTKIPDPCFIFNDNEAAIRIMSTYTNQGRSKHFSIKLRYVVGLVTDGLIRIVFVKSEDNVADILTHSLGPYKFSRMFALIYGPRMSSLTSGIAASFHLGGDSDWRVHATRITQEELRSLLLEIERISKT